MMGSVYGTVIGTGVGSALVGTSMAIMLSAAVISTLVVGIAVGLVVYFLNQDYKQAKAIEDVIGTSSELSSVDACPVDKTVLNKPHASS